MIKKRIEYGISKPGEGKEEINKTWSIWMGGRKRARERERIIKQKETKILAIKSTECKVESWFCFSHLCVIWANDLMTPLCWVLVSSSANDLLRAIREHPCKGCQKDQCSECHRAGSRCHRDHSCSGPGMSYVCPEDHLTSPPNSPTRQVPPSSLLCWWGHRLGGERLVEVTQLGNGRAWTHTRVLWPWSHLLTLRPCSWRHLSGSQFPNLCFVGAQGRGREAGQKRSTWTLSMFPARVTGQ